MSALVTTKNSTKSSTISSEGTVHSIGIAGIRSVKSPDKIRTVLGSCIGVALYDRVAKVGGMAHVILPSSKEGSGDPGKFADSAVDMLIQQIIGEGAVQDRLAAKIAGGAAMFGNQKLQSRLGERNAEAVTDRLKHHAIRLVASAVGGTKGRKMVLDPATGSVQVEIIGEPAELI